MIRPLIHLTLLAGAYCAVPPRPSSTVDSSKVDHLKPDPVKKWFKHFDDSLALMHRTMTVDNKGRQQLDWISAFLRTLTASSLLTYQQAASYGLHPNETHLGVAQYRQSLMDQYKTEAVASIWDQAFDDVQWVVLEWIEAAKVFKKETDYPSILFTTKALERAILFYDRIDHEFDTSLCSGGLTWDPDQKTYKNAITNELYISSSTSLLLHDQTTATYNQVTQNQDNHTLSATLFSASKGPSKQLLQNASRMYNWFMMSNFFNKQHLIIDGFHIPEGSTSCSLREETVYTYNQGVILSGLRGLWEATGNTVYLLDAYRLIEATLLATGWNPSGVTATWSGLGNHGVMQEHCDNSTSCNQDQQTFKGIYFHHLSKFCNPLVAPLMDDKVYSTHQEFCRGLKPWVERNAHRALAVMDNTGMIGGWWGDYDTDEALGGVGQYLTLPGNNEPTEQVKRTHPRQLVVPIEVHSDMKYEKHQNHAAWLFGPRLKRDIAPRELTQTWTLETHSAGVSVIKAALDFNIWYP